MPGGIILTAVLRLRALFGSFRRSAHDNRSPGIGRFVGDSLVPLHYSLCAAQRSCSVKGCSIVTSGSNIDFVVEMPLRHRIEFREVSSPIIETVTKSGGQPAWIGEPQWPVSRETGNPMRFICQVELTRDLFPGTTAQMAYLFMTDEENGEFVDGTYEPETQRPQRRMHY